MAAPKILAPSELNSNLVPVQFRWAGAPSPAASLSSVPEAPGSELRSGWSGGGNPNTGQLLGRGQRGNGARRPGPVGSICSSQDFAFVQSEIKRD